MRGWTTLAITVGVTVTLAGAVFLARSDDPTTADRAASATSLAVTPSSVIATAGVSTVASTVPVADDTTAAPPPPPLTGPATTLPAIAPPATAAPATTAPAPAPAPTVTTVPVAVTSTPPDSQLGPYTFAELPLEAGLLCPDLAARDVDYDDVVLYWFRESYPELDTDLDDIPCEAEYDAATIDTYWSRDHPEAAVLAIARRIDDCGYSVTHVVAIDSLPDGTHDVAVSVDLDLDGTPEADATFNVIAGWEIIPVGPTAATGEALLVCLY